VVTLPYRSPEQLPGLLARLNRKLGRPAFISVCFGSIAALAGCGAFVCALVSRREFLNSWGLAGSLLLILAWLAGGIGAIVGILGLVGKNRAYALRASLFCLATVIILTVIVYLTESARPGGSVPGGF
jgi:hypothetical protein